MLCPHVSLCQPPEQSPGQHSPWEAGGVHGSPGCSCLRLSGPGPCLQEGPAACQEGGLLHPQDACPRGPAQRPSPDARSGPARARWQQPAPHYRAPWGAHLTVRPGLWGRTQAVLTRCSHGHGSARCCSRAWSVCGGLAGALPLRGPRDVLGVPVPPWQDHKAHAVCSLGEPRPLHFPGDQRGRGTCALRRAALAPHRLPFTGPRHLAPRATLWGHGTAWGLWVMPTG